MSVLKIKNGNSWVTALTGGVGIPSGGSANQVIKKDTSTDYDISWQSLSLEDVGIFVVDTAPTSSSPDGLYFVISSS